MREKKGINVIEMNKPRLLFLGKVQEGSKEDPVSFRKEESMTN